MKARRDMASQKKFKMSLKKSYKSEYEHSEDEDEDDESGITKLKNEEEFK